MAIIVGSARSDEDYRLSGGTPGDQRQESSTNDREGEVCMQNMYKHTKGWYILRPKNITHANKMAELMKKACNNKNIGYSQSDRYSLAKYGISTTKKVNCDCSALVRQVIKEATGKDVGDFNTSSEPSVLEKSGLFMAKISYVSQSSTPVYDGDVLVTKTKGHTVIVVSGNPRKATSSTSSSTKPTLKISANVKAIQTWLNKYYKTGLTTDGIYGKNTKKALIKAWQKEVGGLEVDGDFGPKSKTKAEDVILKKGSKGILVTILQATLTCQGCACSGGIDGDFGTGTTSAVKKLQKKHGLEEDGIVGKKSWCAMYE